MIVLARLTWASHESSASITMSGPSGSPHQQNASPPNWRRHFAEHQIHCCLRVPLLALSVSLIPSVPASSLFGHFVALPLASASCGFVAAGLHRFIDGIQRCVCRFRSSNADSPLFDRAHQPQLRSHTSAFERPLVLAPCLWVTR